MTKSESLTKQIEALDSIIAEFNRLQAAESRDLEAQELLQTKLLVKDLRFLRQKELDEILAGQLDDSAVPPEEVRDLETMLERLEGYEKRDQATTTAVSFLLRIVNAARQLGRPPGAGLPFAGPGPRFN